MAVRGALWWQAITALIVAVLVATGTAALIWLLLGRPTVVLEGVSLNASDLYSGLRISLSVVAGLGAVIALVVAYRRQRFNEAQHFLTQVADAREAAKLLGERFRSASEQLGSADAAMRLAGVYAMLDLADDWERKRQMCVDVLCGYLRMPFDIPNDDGELSYSVIYDQTAVKAEPGDSAPGRASTADKETRRELQVRLAIQRGLAAHLRNPSKKQKGGEEILEFWPEVRIDLYGSTLCNFDLDGCEVTRADFRRASFLGDAKFRNLCASSGADFAGATFFGGASFAGATFGGDANFVDTRFMRMASFVESDFASEGEFRRAVFESDAYFDASTFRAGAEFSYSHFKGKVSFEKSAAQAGHRLVRARVSDEGANHVLPLGYEVVDGRLQRTT